MTNSNTEVHTATRHQERLAVAPSPNVPRARQHVAAPPRRKRVIDTPQAPPRFHPPANPIGWARILTGAALALLVLGPLVALVVRAGTAEWIPGGDRAVIEMHVRDVGSHTPLVGPYSRYGWSHPGPLSYWALAIPYRVLGSSSASLLAATALLNLMSIGATMAIMWRRGRLPLLALSALGLSLLCRALVPANLMDPWNPYTTVLPLLVFIALGWTLREGDRWAAPAAVLAGSFLVQSHVGYAGIVVLVLGWAGSGWLHDRYVAASGTRLARFGLAARPGPAIAASALVLGACWAPVAVDQTAGSHNLTHIADYFANSTDEPAGIGYALGVATRQIAGLPLGEGRTRPVWLGGEQPVSPHGGGEVPVNPNWLVLAGAVFVLVAARVRQSAREAPDPGDRLRASGAFRFQLLAGLCAAAGTVSVARITGVVYNYLILWWPVLAMLVWLSAAWSLWCVVSVAVHRRQGAALLWLRRSAAIVAVLASASSSVAFVLSILESHPPEEYHRDPVTALAAPTIAATPAGGPILVESAGGGPTNMTDGLRLQLERAGRPTVSRSEDAYKFGAHRDAGTNRPVTEVWVVSGDAIAEWSRRGDLRQVAIWDPVAPARRASYFEDVEVLRNQLLAAHRLDLFDALYSEGSLSDAYGLKAVDKALLRRVDELRSKGRPLGVFVRSAPTP